MKKAKLISCISVVATTPIFISSCSQAKSYTVMLTSPCTVHAQTNAIAEDVLVASKVYIVDPDHKSATINISESKLNVEGPYLENPYLVINEEDHSAVDIMADVNNWDGKKIDIGIINLKIEFVLNDKTPIDYTTSVLIDHDYRVFPPNPVIQIGTSVANELSLSLHDGIGDEVSGEVKWSVINTPEGYENKFNFVNNVLKFSGEPVASLSNKEVKIKASYNDYNIIQNVIITYIA